MRACRALYSALAGAPARAPHLVVTASAPRPPTWTPCELTHVRAPTPTVRLLRLRPLGGAEAQQRAACAASLPDLAFPLPAAALPPFAFQAGQWIDLAIPEIAQVGGYSLVSAPCAAQGYFDIAVKRARHPPAAWVHSEQARQGALVAVRVGGAFTLAALPRSYARLVLLAGGVGVNPLYCMLLELASSSSSSSSSSSAPLQRIDLLYSVRTPEELLFAQELRALAGGALAGRLHLHLITTREADGSAGGAALLSREARGALVVDLLSSGSSSVGVLVCGPPAFAESMIQASLAAGVPSVDVHCERWW